MKVVLLTLVFSLFVPPEPGLHDLISSDAILGIWKLENGIELEIFSHGVKYYGRIVSLNEFNHGQTLDSNNPDKKRRMDHLIGKVILSGLVFDDEEGFWNDGKMYAPHLGITANLELKNVTKDSLTAIGSKLIFWRKEFWIRQN